MHSQEKFRSTSRRAREKTFRDAESGTLKTRRIAEDSTLVRRDEYSAAMGDFFTRSQGGVLDAGGIQYVSMRDT